MAQLEFKTSICVVSSHMQTQISGVLMGQISHGKLSNHQSTQLLAVNLVQHTSLVWSQIYLNHTHIPQTPNIHTIPFQSVFLLTRGSSHGFFICHSDVWLAVVDLHFIWEWGWFSQSLNSQESFTVRVQKWGQFIVAALPAQCPSHWATHCASAQFRHVLND